MHSLCQVVGTGHVSNVHCFKFTCHNVYVFETSHLPRGQTIEHQILSISETHIQILVVAKRISVSTYSAVFFPASYLTCQYMV
jgi:hypothetical protein